MDFSVAYEDQTLLIIDKPQGLPVTPGRKDSLCDALFAVRPALARVRGFKAGEGGLLNRLDNDTGGLVLFAKTQAGFHFYTEAMQSERVVKTYYAVVHGHPAAAGEIDHPLGHSKKSARRMLLAGAGRTIRGRALTAHTVWRRVDEKPPLALLEVTITKGVRHQIRLHLASLGCPIVGDRLYNRKGSTALVPFHLLYCFCVRMQSPAGEDLNVNVPVPFAGTWGAVAAASRVAGD
jgi:23S rRNA pseudouridine1911/1915/1917 synthase